MRLVYENSVIDLNKVVKVSVVCCSWNTEIIVATEERSSSVVIDAGITEHTDEQRKSLVHQLALLMGTNDAYEITNNLQLQKLVCK